MTTNLSRLANANHTATATLRINRKGVRAKLAITPVGLVSIGALVSSILLSTAVLVRAARPRQLPDARDAAL